MFTKKTLTRYIINRSLLIQNYLGERIMNEATILSSFLKRTRQNLNQSQFEFASNCGISTEALSMYEREKCSPKLDTLGKIASYLGIDVADMLTNLNR